MLKDKTLSLWAATALLMGACSSGNDNDAPTPPTPDVPTEPAQGEGNTLVVYEANPLFFASDNCFDAIRQRLPEIQAVGTDILWIMPINRLGQKNAIGSPYCIADYMGLNPKYGTIDNLKALVNDAHARGMLFIVDWVANHTAWDNVWITEHPDWFVHDANGNIISPPGTGWNDVAELNYNNNDMRQAMIDAMLYWMKECGVDGFRCDHTDGVPGNFWTEAIRQIRAYKADAFMLAETSSFDAYNYGFDMIYEWAYCTDLQAFFHGRMTLERFIANCNDRQARVPEGKQILRYVVNHDVISEKSPVELYGSNQAILPAYVMTAFFKEVPLIYSGQEAGFDNRTAFINARPLTWKPELQAAYEAIEHAYEATAVARGGQMNVLSAGKAAAWTLTNGSRNCFVAINPTNAELQVKTPMVLAGSKMTELITGESTSLPVAVTLPPYGYTVWGN